MTEFLLFVVLVVTLIRWRVLSQRYRELERRVNRASEPRVEPWELAQLVRRVHRLEQLLEEGAAAAVAGKAPAQASEPVVEPVLAEVEAAPAPAEVPQAVLEPEPVPAAAVEESRPEAVAPPPFVPAAPPAYRAPQPPVHRSSEDWEALVGANWLNKLGVAVLVIAVALFLGYSFTQFGPAGRSAIGLAVSFSLLGAGFVLERRPRYAVFGRGLLGGGWAGLYFTTYAMSALEAAKVIDNPLLGAILLLAVATAMVAHALRYRSQAVVGVAYAAAFLALGITDVTAFSVAALVPLAASLLVIANRFGWPGLVLFSMVATYVTAGSRNEAGAALWSTQAILAIYWLLFETYDLLRARRRSNHVAEQVLLPLNAAAFGLLSWAKWSSAAPDRVWQLTAGMSAAYFVSTLLRAMLRPPSSFPEQEGTWQRVLGGGFEGPVTVAAIASALAVALRLHGQTVNGLLLAEAELLFLAGIWFHQKYPRRLAAALFASMGVKFLVDDLMRHGTVALAGRTMHDWTPLAVLAALLFYGNRAIRTGDKVYGYAASALLAVAIGFETPLHNLGMAWLGLTAALFLFGLLRRQLDFRLQGYGAAALAYFAIAVDQANIGAHSWVPLACGAAVAYALVVAALRASRGVLVELEEEALRTIGSGLTVVSTAALLWRVLPHVWVGPAWMALALVTFEAGLRGWPREFRRQSYALGMLAALVLAVVLLPYPVLVRTDQRLAIAAAVALGYGYAARAVLAGQHRAVFNAASGIGTCFLMVEAWAMLPHILVAPAWAAAVLLLALAGRRPDLDGLGWQAHVAAVAVFLRLAMVNFVSTAAAPERIAASAAAIACLFAAQLILPRSPGYARLYYSLLATVLATALLFQEVSGRMLTVAWGMEGVAWLAAGFPLRDRTLRLSGLALFLVCIGKLFFFDLRQLETLYRILSFFVLGVILVAVSWVYTRFRERIQRYL